MSEPTIAAAGDGPVLARRVEGVPVVAVRVVLRGGARLESLPGQALLAGRMLSEGSQRRDYQQIAGDAEDRGMLLSSFGGYEAIGLAIDALAGDWRLALDWAAELVFEPRFAEARFDWLRRQAQAELEAQADQADLFTARAFLAQLYDPHPRGRPLQGDPASLERLSAADCRRFHGASLAWGGFVAITGEIDERAVVERARELFATLTGDGRPRPLPLEPAPDPMSRREVTTHATDQAHLLIGHRTLSRVHPDYPALELAGVLLGAGSGLTGRIPQRIRERDGLAYAATADAVAGAGLDPGRLTCYLATSPASVARAEAAVRDELARFVGEPLGEAELADARSYLLGREPFRRETARQWSDLLATGAIFGLPLADPHWHAEAIAGLDRAAVETAIARHLDPARVVVTLGLPAAE